MHRCESLGVYAYICTSGSCGRHTQQSKATNSDLNQCLPNAVIRTWVFNSVGHQSHLFLFVFSVLNKEPHHEDVWGSGGIPPHILKVGTRWRWAWRFGLYTLAESIGVSVGPRASLITMEKREKSVLLSGIETRSSSP